MKNKFMFFFVLAAVFLLGNTQVNAKSFWDDYFEKYGPNYFRWGQEVPNIQSWTNKEGYYVNINWGGKGVSCKDFDTTEVNGNEVYAFCPDFYTPYDIYMDVEDLTAKSSNTDVMTVTTKKYDFSKEKEYFNNYRSAYEKLTLNEINEYMDKNKKERFQEKPSFGEFLKLTYNGVGDLDVTDVTAWWQAFGFKSEPTNVYEVIYTGHDLGKTTVTLSAKGKDDIKVDWTIQALSFWGGNMGQGLVEILNNTEKYKDIIRKSYNYYIGENEDISDVINALKGKDITVNFYNQQNGITSKSVLNGKDIKNEVSKGFTYSHKIGLNSSVNKEKIDGILEAENELFIDFAYHGSLPAPYTVEVNIKREITAEIYEKYIKKYNCSDVDDVCHEKLDNDVNEEIEKFFKNAVFTLLYYNPETDKMEIIKNDYKPNEDGKITLSFDHFSTYVLVKNNEYTTKKREIVKNESEVKPVANNKADKAPNNAQTSSMNVVFYLSMALVSLVGIIYIIIKKRKIA